MSESLITELARNLDATIDEVARLPDGSGFAIMSMSLPKSHWLYAEPEFNVPPMPMRMGKDDPEREKMTGMLRAVGRYAVRCATLNGKDDDFDPDALVGNLIIGMLGYYTETGLSDDKWANPPRK